MYIIISLGVFSAVNVIYRMTWNSFCTRNLYSDYRPSVTAVKEIIELEILSGGYLPSF